MNELTNYDRGGSFEDIQASATAGMAMSRQQQEVQAAMIVAKKFPRNYNESMNRVLQICSRKKFAEGATYEFPRGGTKVTGASIRLAEAMAQCWGNIDFGITELEQKNGESQVMAHCWDLETNTRQTKIFTVPHVRQTKNGKQTLTDPRDIYEMVANQGSRRLRACILGVIPSDAVEEALDVCENTLVSNNEKPIEERIPAMLQAFKDNWGVTASQIEAYIGCSPKAFTESALVRLGNVYRSISDGMASADDYFPKVADKKSGKKTLGDI